ncbi:uncharacterized protein LOC107418804 [Ziziphus jujuba]|uniref:Uncharacterized protein LOC107418804 n=1 Tax=Ziziphus jujuba TaxID=326968 RepID=A0A6P3ZSW5_ZIZJJ|nr:uncharacterized protein LOC107418804 [Ziziphus jujuba]
MPCSKTLYLGVRAFDEVKTESKKKKSQSKTSKSSTMKIKSKSSKLEQRNKKIPPLPSSSSSSSNPSEFAFAITRIAVSQICQSVGYRKTHLSALETLTDIATKYLRGIAASASSSAASSNRTQSNLFDIVQALHDLHSVQGFPGASDLHRTDYCLLRSSVLLEITNFVRNTVETPFDRPIPRREEDPTEQKRICDGCWRNHTGAPHVPRWLPEFPDRSKCGVVGSVVEKRRKEEELWENSLGESKNGGGSVIENGDVVGVVVMKKKRELGAKRGKVRFRIGGIEEVKEREAGGGVGLGVNFSRSGVCRGGKRVCLDSEKRRNGCEIEKFSVGTENDDHDDHDGNVVVGER